MVVRCNLNSQSKMREMSSSLSKYTQRLITVGEAKAKAKAQSVVSHLRYETVVWTKNQTTINESSTFDMSQTLLDFSFQHQTITGNGTLPPPIPPHSDVEIECDESDGSESEAETEEEWHNTASLQNLLVDIPLVGYQRQ
jgi:hypothetical protein